MCSFHKTFTLTVVTVSVSVDSVVFTRLCAVILYFIYIYLLIFIYLLKIHYKNYERKIFCIKNFIFVCILCIFLDVYLDNVIGYYIKYLVKLCPVFLYNKLLSCVRRLVLSVILLLTDWYLYSVPLSISLTASNYCPLP